MNNFGIDLRGKLGIFKAKTFFKAEASVKERTFVCEDGSGCDPSPLRSRKITGHWLKDHMKDSVSSHDFEVILDGDTKIKPKDTAVAVEEIAMVCQASAPESESEKPRKVRRKH